MGKEIENVFNSRIYDACLNWLQTSRLTMKMISWESLSNRLKYYLSIDLVCFALWLVRFNCHFSCLYPA